MASIILTKLLHYQNLLYPIASSLPTSPFLHCPEKPSSHLTCYLLQKSHLDHTHESHRPEHLKSSLWSSRIPLQWPHASTNSKASISLLKHWLKHTMGHPRLGQNWPADSPAYQLPCSHLMCPPLSPRWDRETWSPSQALSRKPVCG